MSNPPLAPVAEPDLSALLNQLKLQILIELNCHQWGVVQSFNAAKQTVVVEIAVLRQVVDGTQTPPAFVNKPYPILLDVPVMIPSGGAGFLSFPIAKGDVCLVLFNDRDFDAYWATGNIQEPNSPRLHDLSDGLAIIGFRTQANALSSYDTAQVVLALAGTKVVLGTKVGIQNNTISLLTVLTNLITTLKAWVDTRGDTPNAATITALNSSQTDINNLLQ